MTHLFIWVSCSLVSSLWSSANKAWTFRMILFHLGWFWSPVWSSDLFCLLTNWIRRRPQFPEVSLHHSIEGSTHSTSNSWTCPSKRIWTDRWASYDCCRGFQVPLRPPWQHCHQRWCPQCRPRHQLPDRCTRGSNPWAWTASVQWIPSSRLSRKSMSFYARGFIVSRNKFKL